MNRTDGQATFREDRTAVHRDDRSLGDLFSELSHETSTLFRKEIELARIEMTEKAVTTGKNAAFIGLGGAIAYGAFMVLAFALVFALGTLMPLWVAALIVGLALGAVGYVLIQKGIDTLKTTSVKPERTMKTLKEDQQWMKEQVR